ncbi:hypothetical protein K3495_g12644 [Podosphaera aphanis]|nr:hypothetical protein K3495_g12644 [Podosphaera aphanis]
MIIGHFKKPRCFQSKSGNQLGFYYRSNKKAWMTRELFQEWLLKFNEKIKKEQGHVLLLLDNAPSHISNGLEIANVKIQFLPPNTTSQTQLMDAGIISVFKRHYRNLHLQGALDKVDQGLDNFYRFDQLTAMKWSLVAWKEISSRTISNCFTHTGLFKESIPSHTSHTLEADEQSIELGLHEVFNRLAVRNAMSIANFFNPIEEDQRAIKELDDSQIIEMVQLQEEEEEEEELAEEIPQFSRAEKLKSLGMVITLLDISKEKELEAYRLLKRIQIDTRYSSGTQNTLDRWLI